jgi:hypothetical protein
VLNVAAVANETKPLIKTLVEDRVDLNATNPFGSTVLYEMSSARMRRSSRLSWRKEKMQMLRLSLEWH